MRALMKGAVDRAKKQIQDGNFGTAFDADDALALIESHENLREAYEDALRRATGHAYATGMAEAGEEIQHQEAEYERKQHAKTLAQLRRYEGALMSIAKNTCCDPCQEARRVAQAALAEDR